MSVPDTSTFTLLDVIDEVESSTDDLLKCFSEADGDFNPAYEGAKNSQLNFRDFATNTTVLSLVTVGRNLEGESGNGNISTYNTAFQYPPFTNIKSIHGGSYWVFALFTNGELKCWGYNTVGQLGLGFVNPTKVGTIYTSTETNVKEVFTSHSGYQGFILFNNGTLKSFGSNNYGQLGMGTTTDYNGAVQTTSFTNVKSVSTGANFSFVVFNDGTVKSFGINTSGELGMGNTTNYGSAIQTPSFTNVKKVICGVQATFVLFNDGTIKSFGSNISSQLGMGSGTYGTGTIWTPSFTNVVDVREGYQNFMILLDDGTIRGFGRNDAGQLGATAVNGIATCPVTNIKQLFVGGLFTWLILNDGTFRSFGQNTSGQLGMGNVTNYNKAIQTPTISGVDTILDINLGSFDTRILAVTN